MKKSIANFTALSLLMLLFSACSQDRVLLEKGAGFYEITKKEIVTLDSMGNQTDLKSEVDFGFLTLYARSGGISSGQWILKGETLAYPGSTDVRLGWEVGPTDQNRFVMGKVFTLEGWGKKNIKLTFLANINTREVFHLRRN